MAVAAVHYTVDNHTGVLTLSTPPANYLPDPEFIPPDILSVITSDDQLKGLIIKGEGRNFSAGGDVRNIISMAANPELLSERLQSGNRQLQVIENLDIPVIAAINGICFGGGLEIALACHIRVVSENALLAFPEINQGLMPGMGGIRKLISKVSRFHSISLLLGGDTITASESLAWGITDHIAPRNGAYEYSKTLMSSITSDRPVAVIRSIMRSIRNSQNLPPGQVLEEDIRMFCALAKSESERRKKEAGL